MDHSTQSEPNYSTYPDDMKNRRQWVLWKRETVPGRGKPTKIPYTPATGERASVTDSLTWGTFEDALAAYETGDYDGAGFVFGSGDPYTGIDMDNAVDPDERARELEKLHALGLDDPFAGVKDWAKKPLEQIKHLVHISLSQSGTGLHVIAESKLPGKGGKQRVTRDGADVGAIEMYDTERYFALTGHCLHRGNLVPAQSVVNQIWRHFGFSGNGDTDHGAGWGSGEYDGPVWATDLSVDEAVAKARNAKNGHGDAFAALFDRGDLSAHGGDHSRGDMALIGTLAFYLGPDPEAIDTAFRRSRLFRPKWDEQRGACTYAELTIAKVLREKGSDRKDYYGSRGKSSQGKSGSGAGETAQQTKRQFTIFTIAEYRQRPTPEYRIKGLIRDGGLAAIIGDFGSYKSFIALDMALSIAAGVPWTGFETVPGPVLYVVGEGGGAFQKRVDAWLKVHDLDDVPDFYLLPDAPQLTEDRDRDALLEAIQGLPVVPALVILDTLARTFSGNENAQEDMNRYVAAAGRLQALGSAVLILHHNRKDGGYRGSTALPGALDTMIDAKKTATGVVLTCEKQKDDEPFDTIVLKRQIVPLGDVLADEGDVIDLNVPTSLVFTRDESRSNGGGARGYLSDTQREALTTLAESPEGDLSSTGWLRESGMVESTFYAARRFLLSDGLVEIVKAGKRTYYRISDKGRDVLSPAHTGGTSDAAA
jgi:hypothetical protein